MNSLKYVVLLASIVLVSGRIAFNDILGEEWQLFKLQHSKVYQNIVEERHRYKVFLQNKVEILQHNRLFELGHKSFELGLNEFSDLEHSEFVAMMNGRKNSSIFHELDQESSTFIKPDISAPASFDWRTKGAVTGVKNQGQCGSCWAFSSTGALESQYFLKTKKLISLSEQNLVDCSRSNNGCNGGLQELAFDYIKRNGGIETEAAYPYEARDNRCRYDKSKKSGVTVKGYQTIRQGDEDALKLAVATRGPISIAIDASHHSFQNYKGGVYFEQQCGSGRNDLDHAVLIVGYDTTNGKDYWIVKNSWGKSWGQNGYILMARNKRNNCGVATEALFPLV